MKQAALSLIAIIAVAPVVPSSAQTKCLPTVVGDLRIESLQSVIYGDTRTIRVWLPPGHDTAENAQKRYPVLYVFDGQTVFDNCSAFRGEQELQVDETVTRLIADDPAHHRRWNG